MKFIKRLAIYVDSQKNGPNAIAPCLQNLIQIYIKDLVQGTEKNNEFYKSKLKDAGLRITISKFEELVENELIAQGLKYTNHTDKTISSTKSKLNALHLLFKNQIIKDDNAFTQQLGTYVLKLATELKMNGLISSINLLLIRKFSFKSKSKLLQEHAASFDKHIALFTVKQLMQKKFYLVNSYLQNQVLDQHIEELEDWLLHANTFIINKHSATIHYMHGFIELVCHWHNKNYNALLSTCIAKIEILQSKKENIDSKLGLFLSNKAIAHLYLNDYDAALHSIEHISKFDTPGTHNWTKHQLVKVAVLCHTKQYSEAYQTTTLVTSHKRFKGMKRVVQEEWNIVKANMAILYKLGLVNETTAEMSVKKFRLNRFLNDVPMFSKQKDSNNATIQILHITHLILDKNYNEAFDRIEAIDKYCVRHLRKNNESYRLNCFLKMLIEIPKAGFHRNGVERKVEKYKLRLKQQSIGDTRQQVLTELIPFETLWDMLLNSLSIKFHRGRWRA